MHKSKLKRLPLILVAIAVCIGVAGCGAAAADDRPAPQQEGVTESADAPGAATGEAGEATLSYGETTYTAKLQFCSLTGGEDALFHGTAYDESGTEVGYFDGDFGSLADSPHGEARVDFGATGQFQSADEFVAIGTVAGDIVVTDSSDTGLIVMGGAWDQNGTQLATATLNVSC